MLYARIVDGWVVTTASSSQPVNGYIVAPDWVKAGQTRYNSDLGEFGFVLTLCPGSFFVRDASGWVFSESIFWAEVYDKRDRIFAMTRKIRERASDQNIPVPQEWLDYWQALRDITNQTVDPDNPLAFVWPTPPEN